MVKTYLENYRETLLEEKISYQNKYKTLQNQYKEDVKFVGLLEETNDPNFESFTPRTVNSKNKEKIHELKEEQNTILQNAEEYKSKITELDNKIAELDSVILVATESSKVQQSMLNQIDSDEAYRLKLLETQENERQRIARDLHDSSVQSLTNLVHKIELCSKLIDMDPVRCRLELMTMSKITRDIIDEMRNMIYDLRPMSFDDMGLDVTVERELTRLQNLGNIRIGFDVEGNVNKVNPVIGITLLRIIQEACNNAIKHANADYISVKMIYKKKSISVIIVDNGKGFDVHNVIKKSSNSGFGLPMMRERIYLLSGSIQIDSSEETGTKISVDVPCDEEDK